MWRTLEGGDPPEVLHSLRHPAGGTIVVHHFRHCFPPWQSAGLCALRRGRAVHPGVSTIVVMGSNCWLNELPVPAALTRLWPTHCLVSPLHGRTDAPRGPT